MPAVFMSTPRSRRKRLHLLEPVDKLFARLPEALLRVHMGEPGHVDRREEHVPQFLVDVRRVPFGNRFPQFRDLAFKVPQRPAGIRVVEPDLRRAVLHLFAAHERRKRRAHAPGASRPPSSGPWSAP